MRRPTSVTVFGILNLVFGAFGLCASVVSVVRSAAMPGQQDKAVLDLLKDNESYQAYQTYSAITMPLGFVVAVVLIVAGIGLLNMRSWARITSIGYGCYGIVSMIVSAIVSWLCLIGPLLELTAGDNPEPGNRAFAIAMAGGLAFGVVLGLIYPVLLIFFMTRAKVVAAFGGDAGDDGFPDERFPDGSRPPESGNPYQSPH